MSDDSAERQLRLELMQMDLNLKTRQAFWETPRNLSILLATLVTIVGLLAGVLGYKIGSTPPAPIIIQMLAPPATPAH